MQKPRIPRAKKPRRRNRPTFFSPASSAAASDLEAAVLLGLNANSSAVKRSAGDVIPVVRPTHTGRAKRCGCSTHRSAILCAHGIDTTFSDASARSAFERGSPAHATGQRRGGAGLARRHSRQQRGLRKSRRLSATGAFRRRRARAHLRSLRQADRARPGRQRDPAEEPLRTGKRPRRSGRRPVPGTAAVELRHHHQRRRLRQNHSRSLPAPAADRSRRGHGQRRLRLRPGHRRQPADRGCGRPALQAGGDRPDRRRLERLQVSGAGIAALHRGGDEARRPLRRVDGPARPRPTARRSAPLRPADPGSAPLHG